MIKLAALAFVPMLAATFYVQPEIPQARVVDSPSEAESQDRAFLATLNSEETPASNTQRADREFLARLRAQEVPVRRAIPIELQTPVAPIAAPVARVEAIEEVPEIRRAIPVAAPRADLRGKLSQSYITMAEPEIRRATASNRDRASITILGDQVIITPKASAVVASGSQFR